MCHCQLSSPPKEMTSGSGASFINQCVGLMLKVCMHTKENVRTPAVSVPVINRSPPGNRRAWMSSISHHLNTHIQLYMVNANECASISEAAHQQVTWFSSSANPCTSIMQLYARVSAWLFLHTFPK